MTAHVARGNDSTEWYTPEKWIEPARRVLGKIELDPASSELANTVVKAERFFGINDGALDRPWIAETVFMNPPYARNLIDQFARKLVVHYKAGDIGAAIMLTNNCTEVAWWQFCAAHASAVLLPAGRVKYWRPQGGSGSPLQGQSIMLFGGDLSKFNDEFWSMGVVFS